MHLVTRAFHTSARVLATDCAYFSTCACFYRAWAVWFPRAGMCNVDLYMVWDPERGTGRARRGLFLKP